MLTRICVLVLMIASLAVTLGLSRSASMNVTITARVDHFAEWADSSELIMDTDWSGPIDKVHQRRTATKSITLYTNADAVISARPGSHGGVLTNGSQTLQTAFMLTGDVTLPDASFKPAGSGPGEFFSPQNTYSIAHQSGTGAYALHVTTQATSPPESAPDEGLYTCSIVLTAQW